MVTVPLFSSYGHCPPIVMVTVPLFPFAHRAWCGPGPAHAPVSTHSLGRRIANTLIFRRGERFRSKSSTRLYVLESRSFLFIRVECSGKKPVSESLG